MIQLLPIKAGTNITIVTELGVSTEYNIIKAELEIQERYDFLKLSFVDPTNGDCKNISMYADQIEVFDTKTETLIDIYDLN